tara:strand:+ start:2150 stop:2440 length:291 start_codon:yes stop_codon:yes gene_type:complete
MIISNDRGETLCDQMNDISDTSRRSTPIALLHALPAILLLAGYLWLAIAIAAWALAATLFGSSNWVIATIVALLAPCGIYATARIVGLAIEAERRY